MATAFFGNGAPGRETRLGNQQKHIHSATPTDGLKGSVSHTRTVLKDGRLQEGSLGEEPQDPRLRHILGTGRGGHDRLSGMEEPALAKDQGPSPWQDHIDGVVELLLPKVVHLLLRPVVLWTIGLGFWIKARRSSLEAMIRELHQKGVGGNNKVLPPIVSADLQAVHLVEMGGEGTPVARVVAQDPPVGVDAVKGPHI